MKLINYLSCMSCKSINQIVGLSLFLCPLSIAITVFVQRIMINTYHSYKKCKTLNEFVFDCLLTQQPRNHNHQDAKTAWCLHCFGKQLQWIHGARLEWQMKLQKQDPQRVVFGLNLHWRLLGCWSDQQALEGCQGWHRTPCWLHNAASR